MQTRASTTNLIDVVERSSKTKEAGRDMAIENNITVFTVIWIYLSKGDRERERERERVALDFHIAVSYVYLN